MGFIVLLWMYQSGFFNWDSAAVMAALMSQLAISCAFGQLIQDEASAFETALYKVNWPNMSMENRRILLLLLMGSKRKVNIRAGEAYELNYALFAKVLFIFVWIIEEG